MCWSLASSWRLVLPHLDQLLEVADAAALIALLRRALDRLRQVVELDLVARDVERIGDHAADLQAQDRLELPLPFLDVRLAGRDHRPRCVFTSTGRILKRCRVGVGHDVGDRGEVDFQRIDVEILQADLARQPLGEQFQVQQLVGRLQRISISGRRSPRAGDGRRGACAGRRSACRPRCAPTMPSATSSSSTSARVSRCSTTGGSDRLEGVSGIGSSEPL